MSKMCLGKFAFWRWSIFPKVLLVFILVITPFYFIGIALNERGSASVYSEISQSMISRLHFYTNLLDLEFDKVIRFQNEFVNDDDLIELSGKSEIMTDPEKTFAMIRLQKRLLQLKYSSSYIQDVMAYIPSISYVISANWALVMPGAVPVFNVILLLNFFRGLPKELEESACRRLSCNWILNR